MKPLITKGGEKTIKVIGYTYDADYHCLDCAYKQFGAKLDHPERVGKPLDSEGNEVHPIFNTDEWYANDIYEGNTYAVLSCSDCGAQIAEWEAHD